MTEFSGNSVDIVNIIAPNDVSKFNLSKFMNGPIFSSSMPSLTSRGGKMLAHKSVITMFIENGATAEEAKKKSKQKNEATARGKSIAN